MFAECSTPDCGRPVRPGKTGLCVRCYNYQWLHDPLRDRCSISDCEAPAPHKSGFCGMHHRRWKVHGDPLIGPGRGRAGIKRGIRRLEGRFITKSGYARVRQEDAVGKNLWVLEHRLVMERHLGRELLPGENVHHKNGDRLDNRVENLELWVTRQPRGQRVEDLLAWAKEIIERYG